jgi:hypothetical protein
MNENQNLILMAQQAIKMYIIDNKNANVATKNYLNFDCRSRIFFFSSPNFLYSQQE